jgi:uncharacterized protein
VRRRSFLALASSSLVAAPAAVAGYARWIEPYALNLSSHRCLLPGLEPGPPVRLLHFSDLHASADVPNSLIESAVGMALELKPDLVCLTGDFVTVRGSWDRAWYVRTLSRLTANLPVFATMGNHDGGWLHSGMRDTSAVRGMLQSAGVPVLHNRSVTIPIGGQQIEVVGLGDIWGREFRPARAFGHRCGLSHPRIVMSHNPDTKELMKDYEWDLMLSGHTHGGQVVLPFLGSPWTPVKDMRYVHGLLPWNGRQIHVTSGVGSAHGIRLNCRPELALLELTGSTSTAT